MIRRLLSGLKVVREIVLLVWAEATPFVKARLAIVLILVLATAALAPLGPLALKLIIDRLAGNAAPEITSIVLLISLYVLSQWLARSVGEIRGLIYARAERRIYRSLSERVFSHIIHLPLRFHLNRKTGAICQALDNGLQGYQMVLHQIVFTVLPVIGQLAVIALVLARVDQPAFLGIFVLAIVSYGVAFTIAALRVAGAATATSTAAIDVGAMMTDSILNYETIKLFTAERVTQARIGDALSRTENEWVGFFRRYAINGLGFATIFAGFLALSISYSTLEVLSGRMTVGEFVLVNTYMLQIVAPVETLGYAMQAFSQGAAMLEQMVELLREKPEPTQATSFEASEVAGSLEFSNVSFSYGSRSPVLTNVCFRLPANTTLGIVGASGAGKSTLVRLLVRLLEPNSGHILLDGLPIAEMSLSQLRQAIAVVPQDTVLFNDTIGFNIAIGNPGSAQSDVEHAARQAHVHDLISGLPERYETVVGERGARLSGGEKQRISIARAVLKKPRIYIFDEATSSLDSNTESEILHNLREIARSRTTLIIAHRLSTVVHADQIVVLDNGAIVEVGTHAELLSRGSRYARLWNAQQAGTSGTPEVQNSLRSRTAKTSG